MDEARGIIQPEPKDKHRIRRWSAPIGNRHHRRNQKGKPGQKTERGKHSFLRSQNGGWNKGQLWLG
jgi:hypothetical protein